MHKIIEDVIKKNSLLNNDELNYIKSTTFWDINPLELISLILHISNKWDIKDYLDKYKDVLISGIDPYVHFIKYGYNEGRLLQKKTDTTNSENLWESNLVEEVDFWESLINGTYSNKIWVNNFIKRIKFGELCPKVVKNRINMSNEVLSILDVGAGPVSIFTNIIDGHKINLDAIDPLSDEYNKLFEKYNIIPHHITRYGKAESLTDVVNQKYDIVFSRNALDHSSDPLKSINQMLSVACNGGLVYIEVGYNEGLRHSYNGLHQWNMMSVDNDLVLWNKYGNAKLLSHYIDMSKIQSKEIYRQGKNGWVTIQFVLK